MRIAGIVGAILGLCIVNAAVPQESILFQQDFESGETVGQHPTGSWFFGEQTGSSFLVSDEATDVPGSPAGLYNVKFAKTQTGSGTDLTVQMKWEEDAVSSGTLTITYWVYFASGQLMRHAIRGYSPYKHYQKMVVRGDWPNDVRLEFPINGQQKAVSGDSWHKLMFIVQWDSNANPETTFRFFIDDEEHPGSPAGPLENVVSPIGSMEFNTAASATAICYFDDIKVEKSLPPPEIKSIGRRDGRLALEWGGLALSGKIACLYETEDLAGPWRLLQGNIESPCRVDPEEVGRSFYRVGPEEPPSPDRKVIFEDDFESYSTSEEVETVGRWVVVNGSGAPEATWRLWNTSGEPLNLEDPNLVGMSGNYMISNSDFAQSVRLDEEFISPEIECAGYKNVGVEFGCNVKIYEEGSETDPQITDLDLCVYDSDSGTWSPWMNVFTRDMTTGDWASDTPRFFSLSPLADGRRVKLRWRFHEAEYDYWWAIDNVRVSGE